MRRISRIQGFKLMPHRQCRFDDENKVLIEYHSMISYSRFGSFYRLQFRSVSHRGQATDENFEEKNLFWSLFLRAANDPATSSLLQRSLQHIPPISTCLSNLFTQLAAASSNDYQYSKIRMLVDGAPPVKTFKELSKERYRHCQAVSTRQLWTALESKV